MYYMEIYGIGALMGMVVALYSMVVKLEKKMFQMNLILDKVAEQVGVPKLSLDDELKKLIVVGKKIQAIKELREATGLGLKEAKDYVDNL